MGRKLFVFFLISALLLLSAAGEAATLHGKIYTMDLELAKGVIITVNTEPKQTFVSKDGLYSLEINEGEYTIEAFMESFQRKYTSKESIKIKDDGIYVLDILLFPDLSDEIDLIEKDFDFSDIIEKEASPEDYLSTVIIVAITLIIIAVAYAYHTTKKVRKTKPKKEAGLSDKVLNFIKNEDGRTTQKEIRRQFPFSEAKISLVITELEDKGIIKKIKKGRGNVIVMIT